LRKGEVTVMVSLHVCICLRHSMLSQPRRDMPDCHERLLLSADRDLVA
jgi:hypothetical protein